jgi:hypothetical protein
MTFITVNVNASQTSVKELLSLVMEEKEIMLIEHITPVAHLIAIGILDIPRTAGLYSSATWTNDSFAQPKNF